MRSPSRRHRQRLLEEAFERGIRHFDVARMYGLGVAERELGRFARGRRDRIAIATKFGIEASGPASRLAPLQAPARAAIGRLPALRARLKAREGAFHASGRYDGATARSSLQASLEALGTDYVDVLFVHDPEPGARIDLEELTETLEQLRGEGLIGAWGFAGEPGPCLTLSRAAPVPTVLQVRDEIFAPCPERSEGGTIAFGVLSRAAERIARHLAADGERRRRWAQEIGSDCSRPDALASLLLRDALERNRDGTVLFSTSRPERVAAAVGVAESSPSEEAASALRAFRRCAAEVVAGG